MATKKDIMNDLTKLGVDYDPNSTVAELNKILADAEKVAGQEETPEADSAAPKAKAAAEADTTDPKAKDFSKNQSVGPQGSPEVETGPGLKIEKDVSDKRLKELEKEGSLYGWDPATRTASLKI